MRRTHPIHSKDMEDYETRNLHFDIATATCIRTGWYRKVGNKVFCYEHVNFLSPSETKYPRYLSWKENFKFHLSTFSKKFDHLKDEDVVVDLVPTEGEKQERFVEDALALSKDDEIEMEIPVNEGDEIEMEIPVNEDDEIKMEIPHEDIGEKVPFQRVLKRAMEIKYLIDEIREEATIWEDEESTYEFVREIKDAMENSKADFHLLEKKESGSKIGSVVSKESKETPENNIDNDTKEESGSKIGSEVSKESKETPEKNIDDDTKDVKKRQAKGKEKDAVIKMEIGKREKKISHFKKSPYVPGDYRMKRKGTAEK